MSVDLEVLLRVQDLDTALARLRHGRAALPERQELAAADAALAALAVRSRSLEDRRQALLDRQTAFEEQIAVLNERRQAIEDRLYSARGSAARDLQAMNEEVGHLSRHRAEVEDAELEVMEEQEPVEAELAQLASERAQVAEAADGLRGALAAAEAVVDAEISTIEATRAMEAGRLPGELLRRYEDLRTRLHGEGAARLVGNRCEGCHLELPAAEVDRIRRLPGDAIATCDNCGRILVRAA